ncbi:MAG: glycosyltransferase [Nitrospiraceae bacterium]|nr:glycosyltransferase [Nitrospiraceae bacterium]
MKNGPLISVIMPLYNKRQYVARAVKSVLEQTYANWELIIVDDGSTDGSSDAIPSGNPRIKLLRQTNRGPAAARNVAVRAASGEYVAFIDADDCYYPFKLEQEIACLWEGQKAEWMMSAYDWQVNGKTTRYYMKDINREEVNKETKVFDDALEQLTVSGWPSDGLFMKKSLFERLGGFNENMRYGEISEFILRCAAAQPRVLICHLSLYLHIDVPLSTAKVTNRNEFHKQIGKTLVGLAKNYPQYSGLLIGRGYSHLISYSQSLILEGKGREARRFLFEEFRMEFLARWALLWMASWLPKGLLARIPKTAKGWL